METRRVGDDSLSFYALKRWNSTDAQAHKHEFPLFYTVAHTEFGTLHYRQHRQIHWSLRATCPMATTPTHYSMPTAFVVAMAMVALRCRPNRISMEMKLFLPAVESLNPPLR
jgi:hypothetical protein